MSPDVSGGIRRRDRKSAPPRPRAFGTETELMRIEMAVNEEFLSPETLRIGVMMGLTLIYYLAFALAYLRLALPCSLPFARFFFLSFFFLIRLFLSLSLARSFVAHSQALSPSRTVCHSL